jgi:ketosteroid isomerase-like protein
MDEGATRAAVEAYYRAVSGGDIDEVVAMFTPDAVMRDPVGAPPVLFEDARRQRYAAIGAMFDTFTIVPQRIYAAGTGEAAASWDVSARTKTGQDIAFSGISTFTFAPDGRITNMSAYFDTSSLFSGAGG